MNSNSAPAPRPAVKSNGAKNYIRGLNRVKVDASNKVVSRYQDDSTPQTLIKNFK